MFEARDLDVALGLVAEPGSTGGRQYMHGDDNVLVRHMQCRHADGYCRYDAEARCLANTCIDVDHQGGIAKTAKMLFNGPSFIIAWTPPGYNKTGHSPAARSQGQSILYQSSRLFHINYAKLT